MSFEKAMPLKSDQRAAERAVWSVSRLLPVDALRGLLMVLMALDHANHFVAQRHSSGEYWGGPLPVYPSALAFLTRFVTHFCAPGFFFLMGVGMVWFAISRQRQGWTRWAVVRYFWIRGGLLIGLQLWIENRAWALTSSGWPATTYIGVLYALGCAMILGSLLLWLEPQWLLALSAVLALGTELLTPSPSLWNRAFPVLTHLLLIPGGDRELWVNYPLLPWLGLACFGLAFGHWLKDHHHQAYGRALRLGVAFLLAFVVLRWINGFGNIRPAVGNSWVNFLNVVKYPPSITFQLLTVGVNLIVMWVFAQASALWQQFLRPLTVFGRVPLFFYATHLFLYAGLGRYLTPRGTSIPQMYFYWLLGLLILFPACVWYGRFKQRQPAHSVWRVL